MNDNKKTTINKTKPNIEHFIVQLNTRGHIHKDKKKEIERKNKYRKDYKNDKRPN